MVVLVASDRKWFKLAQVSKETPGLTANCPDVQMGLCVIGSGISWLSLELGRISFCFTFALRVSSSQAGYLSVAK